MDDSNTDDNLKNQPSEEDQPSAQPEEQVSEPATQPEEVTQVEPEAEKQVEETSSDVIANPEEMKQSSQETEPTQITTKPLAPRNDNNKTSETTDTTTTEEPAPAQTEPAKPSKKDNPRARWYVVHTYSGHENKVAAALKQRIESEGLEKKILEILVPTQDKIEIRGGKKATVKEKVFPGYILVKMDLDDTSWLAVRTTQGVTSFVGIGNKPTPISDAEVQTIVKFTMEEAPSYKQVFAVSDTVKIVDGPFAEFIGKVDAVDEEKGKIRVLVSIFGRETPVELDFLQVQKI